MREEGKTIIAAGQPLHHRTKEYRRVAHHSAHAKKHPHNRWVLKLSVCILIFCVAIWCWQKIANPQTLPVKTIQITGNYQHADQNQLRQLILPYVAKGFLWMDTSALQDQLQQLPWIYNATVKREWPNKLAINFTEQKPVARMNSTTLVNEQGDTFVVDQSTVPAGLPLFVTPLDGQQKLMLDNFKTMNTILAPLALKIVAISLDARQSWSLQLDNGIVLILGKVDPVSRLQRFVQVYSQVVGANAANIISIDLRYTSGVAVRFKNPAKTN